MGENKIFQSNNMTEGNGSDPAGNTAQNSQQYAQQNGYNGQQNGYNYQQGGYNYQQNGYNGQQGGYNYQQNGYNGQQGGYNYQQNGYNGQQGGYNYQQNGYNGQRNDYNARQGNGQKKTNAATVIIIVVCSLLLAGAAAAAGYFFIFKGDNNDAGKDVSYSVSGQDGDSHASNVTSPPTPTSPPAPVFGTLDASSTRGSDYDSAAGVNVYYYKEYAVDGDMTTSWSSDRNIELTPTFTLRADSKQHVTGVRMTNGYCKSEKTYTWNRRISQVTISYEGGSQTFSLDTDAYRVMQELEFDAPVDTSYIKIHVDDTVYGKWLDVAISEIEVY